MANTMYLRKIVEQHVRDMLADRYRQPFTDKVLTLASGGTHEFDAVAEDQSVVASIKSASGRTSGGNIPSGKIKDSTAELYYLTLVEAPERMLVLTNEEFYEIFTKRMDGRIAPGVEAVHIPLPDDVSEEAKRVQQVASDEMISPTSPEG